MRKIYQRATGTLIWLGRDECDLAKQTFAILREYTKDVIRELGLSKDLICQHPDLSDLVEKYASKYPTNLTWAVDQAKVMAIGKLYKQSWFERLWVMQELNMSSKCSSWWGSTSEDSRWLAFVACCLVNDLDAKTYMQSMTYAQCAATMVRPAGNQTISTSILEIMHATSKFKATDARDRVFALLSMEIFQLLPDRPTVDYELTKSEVFRQLAEALIRSSSSSLDCLSYVGHGHVDLSNRSYSESRTKQEREQIFSPSWVPVWDSNVREAKSALCASPMNFDAWPGRHRPPKVVGSRLLMKGIIVDEVISAVSTQESMTGFQPGIKRSYLDIEGVNFWQQLLVDTPRYSGIMITDEVYGATLTLGSAIRTSSEVDTYHLSDFLAQRFGDKLCFPGWGLRRPQKFIAHDNDMSVAMRLFMRSVADYGTLRLFIRTKTGYIGMAPHVTKAGDAVALLAGSRVPLILRPTSNGQFVVLGDAYVHGIMFGEVFDQMNSGVIPGLEQRQIIIV